MAGQGRWALAVLSLAACSKPVAAPVAEAPIAVSLATAEPATDSGTIQITGTVRLKRETLLGFNTPGRIAAITVLEGQSVGAGQVLARLDPTGLDAASASAGADAVRAAADLKRMAALVDKGWVTRSRMESAEATAAAARARVAETSFDQRLGRIVAPAAGVVLRRAAEPGQMVAAGTPVLTVGELASGYILRLPLSDGDLSRVAIGQRATVILAALSPVPLPATVSEVGARGDDRTGTFQVELRLPAAPGMRSGLIGTAKLGMARPVRAGGAITVPASAVFSPRADEGFVYVFSPASGTVKMRLVQLGDLGDDAITVTSGLQAGERVVRSGVDRLRDGMTVTVAKMSPAG